MSRDTMSIEYESALDRYALALRTLSSATPVPTEEQALDVLLTRDTLREAKSDVAQGAAPCAARLIELDERLKQQGGAIATAADLETWRSSIQPPAESWWWYFEPATTQHAWDRFDWMWNGLTAGALALAASFMVGIYQAFSVGGLSWGETFSTITQGAGLALIGQGALTTQGQDKVKLILSRLRISPQYYSEATCLFAMALLLVVYVVHTALPEFFYNRGLAYYAQGHLGDAEEKYIQAMAIEPQDTRFNVALGNVYESLGSLDQALDQYKRALLRGELEAFNDIGRVYVQRFDPIKKRTDPVLAETFLRMGIQRAETGEGIDENTRFQLYRNLGWSLAAQKRHKDARVAFTKAIQLDQQIPGNQIGGGMSYCFLAQTYETLGQKDEAQVQWKECLAHARPESINEYKWFMSVNEAKLANCIDTSSIVEGNALSSAFKTTCQANLQLSGLPPQTPASAIEKVRVALHDQINRKWNSTLPVEQDISYQVSVDAGGSVLNYQPLDQPASTYANATPLPALATSSEPAQATFAQFKVVFAPTGAFQVDTWQ